jgi:outer membrane protein OmpA-like peptidoglycan-associated protein
MANASGSVGFELGPNKFDTHVTGKASAAVDLVKCEAKIDAYAPSKTGLALRVPPIPAEYQENPTLKLSDHFRQRTTGTLSRHPDKPFPYANFFPRINFDFDSSFVKPGQLLRLRRLERLLNENPKYKVQIVGHTDQIGTDSYNMSLSERRARVVYAYIQT